MSAKKIPIDAQEVYKLAQLGCKNEEIADFYRCSTNTIERRFGGELAKGRSELRMSLRRWQLASAQKGNVAMLIWLGKQMLGQIERSQIDLSKIPIDIFLEEAKKRLEDGSK